MNALDALFVRQVPGGAADRSGNDKEASSNLSRENGFAAALSGQSRKAEREALAADKQGDDLGDAIDPDTEAPITLGSENPRRTGQRLSEESLAAILEGRLTPSARPTRTDDSEDPQPDAHAGDAGNVPATPVADIEINAAPVDPLLASPADARQAMATGLEPAPGGMPSGESVRHSAGGPAPADQVMANAVAANRPARSGPGKADAAPLAAPTGARAAASGMDIIAAASDAQTQGEASGDREQPRSQAETLHKVRVASTAANEREGALEGVKVIERRSFLAPEPSRNADLLVRSMGREVGAMLTPPGGKPAPGAAANASTAATAAQSPSAASPAGQKVHTLKLQLNPLSLGQVTAVLRLSGEELNVQLKVETAEAYRQLSSDSASIIKALRAQGFGVENVSVQHVLPDRPTTTGQGASSAGQAFQSQSDNAAAHGGGNARNGEEQKSSPRQPQTRDSGDDTMAASGTSGSRSDGVYL
ncbi:flagellar hook-length control protein FliK [Pseudohoeflea coraliihabitans]|uniref:Flagellar hook-length control protein FliK n=1 Tax=Pseudohoeflea coraliihabitans TaxID=2860393 RepID=A0ABS6WN18_9HYPH|nr:flagellar hook-length control protein FliK [Pseudohoeflea sp. DP4N28-3]MBW3097357.1 flagellar hook-length control protein FliK [Pseudohoeflea sp. DP4N28-3]